MKLKVAVREIRLVASGIRGAMGEDRTAKQWANKLEAIAKRIEARLEDENAWLRRWVKR